MVSPSTASSRAGAGGGWGLDEEVDSDEFGVWRTYGPVHLSSESRVRYALL